VLGQRWRECGSQRGKAGGLLVAVEDIVGLEWNQPPVAPGDMDTGALQRADVERARIHELHDEHAKDVVVAQLPGCSHAGQAAQSMWTKRPIDLLRRAVVIGTPSRSIAHLARLWTRVSANAHVEIRSVLTRARTIARSQGR